jgi:hypothetical protein
MITLGLGPYGDKNLVALPPPSLSLTIKMWQINFGCLIVFQDWVDEVHRGGLGSWSLMEIENVNCFVR